MLDLSKTYVADKDDTSLFDFPVAASTVVCIQTSKIIPNPSQPRKAFSDRALSTLADSIKRHGVLQPLLVRKQGDEYELIAGERRLRAASMAGIDKVPCIIREADPTHSAELAIIENLQREDLNMFEEAEAIRALIEKCGMTQEMAATRLSCSQSYVANKLRLLKLPELHRRVILDSHLTERHARALLRIRDNDERSDVISMILERRLNVSAAEDLIEDYLCKKERAASHERIQNVKRELCTRLLSKDMRLFYNSIDRAVDSVRSCGFSVRSDRRSVDGGIEISIFVKNKDTV